jgi:ADP-heptose:LPS heptosyltransferase
MPFPELANSRPMKSRPRTTIAALAQAYASTFTRWVRLRMPSQKVNETIQRDQEFCRHLSQDTQNTSPNRTAIIRVDDIGDFIVFRQSLQSIRNHPKLKDTELWLVGNAAWKTLAEAWDPHIFDKIFWLDKAKFLRDLSYRTHVFSQLRDLRFQTVLSPSFTRNPVLEDALVLGCGARETIGWNAPLSSLAPGVLRRSLSLYSLAITPKTQIAHERDRGLEFWTLLFSHPAWISEPQIIPEFIPVPTPPPKDNRRIVLVPGTGIKSKIWAPKNFAELAQEISSKRNTPAEFWIVGGPGDKHLAQSIMQHAPHLTWRDFTGQTTLPQLSESIAGAALVVSGDTGAANLAAFLGTSLLVLSCGTAWSRFFPFKRERLVCVPTPAFRAILHWKGEDACHAWRGSTKINEITANMVFEAIKENHLLDGLGAK